MSDKLKDACAYIEVAGSFGKRRGTGFLVRPDRVATCEHVVRGAAADARIVVRFPSGERLATVEKLDAENDCAVLRLDEPLTGVTPLPLSQTSPKDAPWQAYGFPQATLQGGLLLDGKVQDPQGEDRRRSPSLVLFSPSAIGGAELQGFSGSPVLVNGQVVGHLKQVIPDADGGAMMGFLYACPARYLESLLPPGATRSARPGRAGRRDPVGAREDPGGRQRGARSLAAATSGTCERTSGRRAHPRRGRGRRARKKASGAVLTSHAGEGVRCAERTSGARERRPCLAQREVPAPHRLQADTGPGVVAQHRVRGSRRGSGELR